MMEMTQSSMNATFETVILVTFAIPVAEWQQLYISDTIRTCIQYSKVCAHKRISGLKLFVISYNSASKISIRAFITIGNAYLPTAEGAVVGDELSER